MSEHEFNIIFAKNLQYFLELNNMKPAELARKLEVAESTISRWLAAETSPRMDKVDKMVGIFRIKRSDLITTRKASDNYYFDAETRDVADKISKEKGLRLLFDVARDADPKVVKAAYEMIKALEDEEEGDTE